MGKTMKRETKGILIYVSNFLVILFCSTIVNGKSIIEILLRRWKLGTGYSSGNYGTYYPGVIALLFIFGSWILLRCVYKEKHAKMVKNYPYIVFVMAITVGMISKLIKI